MDVQNSKTTSAKTEFNSSGDDSGSACETVSVDNREVSSEDKN